MTLSVLSTFARLGMDPWQEAGRLAKLPQAAAVEGLARIIAAMPASLWSLPDATATAARLVTLLPAHGGSPSNAPAARSAGAETIAARLLALLPIPGGRSSIARSAQRASAPSRTTRRWMVVLALLGIVLAGLAWNLTGHRGAVSDSDAAVHWSAGHAAMGE